MSSPTRGRMIRSLPMGAAPLLSRDFVWSDRLRAPGAQFDEAKQKLVPLRLQLLDGARSDLGMDAVDELFLHLRRQHRRAEALPRSHQGAGELLEEVLDAARAAAEVIEHHVAHDAPAQTRSPAQGGVDVGGAQNAVGNEV